MCELCHDMGFVVNRELPIHHPDFGKALPCACTLERRKAKQQSKLQALDGLTAIERSHTFASTRPSPDQTTMRDSLRDAVAGIYVLQGTPGSGKSHFLHCVVNQARERGQVAVYATLPDVLDYLRSAFNPKVEEPFEERWKLLIECPVLCLDELDEFNATEWARERFLRLIDERWRSRDERLTVVALNGDARLLIPKVASRLLQGKVLAMKGVDMRTTFKDMVPA